MQLDTKELLMAKFLPNTSTDQGMPLAIASPQTNQYIDAECEAIAPIQQQNLSVHDQLLQKLDGQQVFVQQGFEHLISQGQLFEQRLTQLERQSAQPVYQLPVQHSQIQQYQPLDITPVFQHMLYQQQGMTQLAQNQNQTNLAIANLTHAMQKFSDRPTTPTVINHFVDNTVHNDNHSVEIHGDNYGNICTDGVQKGGAGFWVFALCGFACLVIGINLHGK